MPDLLSHALVGHALHRGARDRTSHVLVLVGSLLPDLLSWLPLTIYLKAESAFDLPSEVERYFAPMHAPLLTVLWCVLLALPFVTPSRRMAMGSLLLGAMGHVGLDLLQWKYDGGYLVFYPCHFRRFQVGVLHQDRWPWWIAICAVAALAAEIAWRRARRRARVGP